MPSNIDALKKNAKQFLRETRFATSALMTVVHLSKIVRLYIDIKIVLKTKKNIATFLQPPRKSFQTKGLQGDGFPAIPKPSKK